MKMPPFIVGAGVLFWGFQTTFEWLAVIMAAVLEGARWTPRRWRILAADVSRVWDVCLVLLLGAAVYSYTSSDITYTVLAFLQCLPMIFFLFMCALAWGGLDGTFWAMTIKSLFHLSSIT